MIYTEMTKKALRLMFDAHKEQVDKSGIPYVFHPFHLAEQMDDEETTIAALLHDVMEDTDTTVHQIRGYGFSEAIIEALLLLTHDKGTEYFDYIKKIKQNRIAKAVKIADLKHNSDISRLAVVDEKTMKRIEKYKTAIAILAET